MKRSSTLLSAGLLALLLAFVAAPGCGAAGGPNGDPTAALASCNAYCEAYLAAACTLPNYMSVDDCKAAECRHLPEAPGICQTKIKAYYDCAKALAPADICSDTACADEFSAVLTCQ
ncbi:MAG TPA: hypothetical protein VIF57_27630 [Polyangia bacterium]